MMNLAAPRAREATQSLRRLLADRGHPTRGAFEIDATGLDAVGQALEGRAGLNFNGQNIRVILASALRPGAWVEMGRAIQAGQCRVTLHALRYLERRGQVLLLADVVGWNSACTHRNARAPLSK